jgi:Flp pilus assembly protein TadG
VIGSAAFLRRRLAALRGERGSASISFLLVSVSLIVVIGLVVDGAGKIQANERADLVAASAARAATNAIGGDTVRVGALSLDPVKAVAKGEEYIAATGMAGSVSVTGEVVTVTVSTTYTTRFLSLIGVVELPGTGEASARLITE